MSFTIFIQCLDLFLFIHSLQAVLNDMISEVHDYDHPQHYGTYMPEQEYISRFYGTFDQWTHIACNFNFEIDKNETWFIFVGQTQVVTIDLLDFDRIGDLKQPQYKWWVGASAPNDHIFDRPNWRLAVTNHARDMIRVNYINIYKCYSGHMVALTTSTACFIAAIIPKISQNDLFSACM